MSIQKKSLIAALKTAKAVNVAGVKPEADATKVVSTKLSSARASLKSLTSLKKGSMKRLSQRASARASMKASARASMKASLRSAQ